MLGAKVYFDCTWPLDWDPADKPDRVSFAEVYPPEVQQMTCNKSIRVYRYLLTLILIINKTAIMLAAAVIMKPS